MTSVASVLRVDTAAFAVSVTLAKQLEGSNPPNGRPRWRVWLRHTVNERDEAVDEPAIYAALWDALHAVGVLVHRCEKRATGHRWGESG